MPNIFLHISALLKEPHCQVSKLSKFAQGWDWMTELLSNVNETATFSTKAKLDIELFSFQFHKISKNSGAYF